MQRPRLKATLALPSSSGGDLTLLFGPRAFDLRVSQGHPPCLGELLGCLSGAYNCAEIAHKTGLSVDSVRTITGQLVSRGLAYDYTDPPTREEVSRQELLALFEAMTTVLRFDMFRQPLFSELFRNERLFLATALEYFHLIRDAESHMSVAFEHAPANLRDLVDEYRRSERDHYRVLEAALAGAIGGSFSFERLQPLMSTEAVMLKTRDLARSDTLAYLGCCCFSEARLGSERAVAPQGWARPIASVFDAFADHAAEDINESHSALFARAAGSTSGQFSADRVSLILSGLHEFKHYLDNLNFEILRVYSQRGSSLPRLKDRPEDFLLT